MHTKFHFRSKDFAEKVVLVRWETFFAHYCCIVRDCEKKSKSDGLGIWEVSLAFSGYYDMSPHICASVSWLLSGTTLTIGVLGQQMLHAKVRQRDLYDAISKVNHRPSTFWSSWSNTLTRSTKLCVYVNLREYLDIFK